MFSKIEAKEIERQLDEIELEFDTLYNTMSRDQLISAEVLSSNAQDEIGNVEDNQ